MCTAPAVHADQVTIQLDKTVTNPIRPAIVAHLSYMEIGDDRKGSTKTTTPIDRVKWARLYYYYENDGSSADSGNMNLQFIDDMGNAYSPDAGTSTSEEVAPYSNSTLQFVEIPVSKDSNIVTIRFRQGFDYVDVAVPQPGNSTSTPVPVTTATTIPTDTATPTANATAQSTGSAGGCLPFFTLRPHRRHRRAGHCCQ